jgi:gamma-glutamylcyclotransferase (GGCT)/AIG2-like uncharacterized protein YtfP
MFSETNLLFIYGTLLPLMNHPKAVWLKERSSQICDGYMHGYLYLVNNTYPAAVYKTEAQEKIFGLIVKMHDTEHILAVLDDYEEVGEMFAKPNEYYRDVKKVFGSNGDLYLCWTYLYNLDYTGLPLIDGGDFIKYRRNNNIL